MNSREVSIVLAKIVLGDNRQTDDAVFAYWVEGIGGLKLEDALAAVAEHRREHPGVWLDVGHVVAGARRAKDIRDRDARKQAAIAAPAPITLDRASFEAETQRWVDYYREHPDER